MSKLRLSLLASCVLAATVMAANAVSITLHMSTGLWETTSLVKMSGINAMGNMTPEQMANMPPAARAQMQAMMASLNGVHKNTQKSCITQKELDHPFRTNMGDSHMTCTDTIVSGTPSEEKIHVVCTGERSAEGDFHFMMDSPTTMHGHMELVSTQDGHSMTFKNDMTGRWLGASCGDLKPADSE
jgi:hypothetical protein